jgi:hypothetical protein
VWRTQTRGLLPLPMRTEPSKDVFNPNVSNVRWAPGVASYPTPRRHTICLRGRPIELNMPNATPIRPGSRLRANCCHDHLPKHGWSFLLPQEFAHLGEMGSRRSFTGRLVRDLVIAHNLYTRRVQVLKKTAGMAGTGASVFHPAVAMSDGQ